MGKKIKRGAPDLAFRAFRGWSGPGLSWFFLACIRGWFVDGSWMENWNNSSPLMGQNHSNYIVIHPTSKVLFSLKY